MGFHTNYPNRKDWRRARAHMKGCRPIGGCSWCLSNKEHHLKKQLLRAFDDAIVDGRQVKPRRKHPRQVRISP